jgi:hypothetical protein
MGNSAATNEYGGIHLQLDSSIFHPGETIQGTVHISLSKPLLTCRLEILFQGTEVTNWMEHHSSQSASRVIVHEGHCSIAKIKHEAMRWNNGLEIGHYSIPIAFDAPGNIPGSFRYAHQGTSAKILYFILVKLVFGSKAIQCDQPISIVQGPIEIRTDIKLAKVVRLRTLCCVNKGTSKVNVFWPEDAYESNQVAECILEIDNTYSKIDVNRIEIRLYYDLQIRDNGNFYFSRGEMLTENDYKIRVKAGENMSGERATKLQVDLRSLKKELKDVHTVNGNLIKCSFFIEVKAKYSGLFMCCGDLPKMVSRVHIRPMFENSPNAIAPPIGWNPLVYDAVQMHYDPRIPPPDDEAILLPENAENPAYINEPAIVVQASEIVPSLPDAVPSK